MVKQKLTIGHLYPKQMNVYGDMGNIITLKYRLQQRDIEFDYVSVDSLKILTEKKIDILIGGGGQDSRNRLFQYGDTGWRKSINW